MSSLPRLCRAALLLVGLCMATGLYARPALWIASKGHSTVYLLGTVHLLPADSDWRWPALGQALARSQDLTIELTDDDPASLQPLLVRYGMDPARPLSDKLDAADRQALERAAQQARLPGGAAALQPMQPWLAALTLTMTPLTQAGLDPDAGVDKQLRAQMSAAGKPVHGLETAEQQLRLLADLPQAQQLDFLRQSFGEVADGTDKVQALIDAWKNGDVAAIAHIEDTDLRKDSPQLYQSLIVQRNQAWAHTIAERMNQPGVHFVAVGAGHLAGPDSLQVQLEKLGYQVQRQ